MHLQELVEAYEAEAKATGNPQLLLTAAVSAGKGTIDAGYEIAEIARYSISVWNGWHFEFKAKVASLLTLRTILMCLQISGLHQCDDL